MTTIDIKQKTNIKSTKPSIFSVLKPYRLMIFALIGFALISNAVNLLIPKLISNGIDDYSAGHFDYKQLSLEFLAATVIILILTLLQGVLQTYASEKVARNLRSELINKISQQSYTFVQQETASKLLTNLTSDVDSIKLFVSMAVVSMASSIFIIIGASVLLISINWELALSVLAIIPIISVAFAIIFSKVGVLFKKSREVIDWLNKVINESIIGASLVRVLNSQSMEYSKFLEANTKARDLTISILKLFATLMPIVVFVGNLASLTILALGGHYVITGAMTIGDFAAFSSYLVMLIFPIMVIGFISNYMSQASVSYKRIYSVLNAEDTKDTGNISKVIEGKIEFTNINVSFGQKPILKNISFTVPKASKTAIIGPTAAGKTQLMYLLAGLIKQNEGRITIDDIDINEYNKDTFQQQIGFVFQDSVIFNMSLRENIAFNGNASNDSLKKAIDTAELNDFINSLPEGLESFVSERGNSLSGGQKQRIMLARALVINPKILILDDFTARVDSQTEQRILKNVSQNYPETTLLSVTQKIDSVVNYEQVILLEEGEIIAKGTHRELIECCPEYIQIYNSQKSTTKLTVENNKG